eukprot:gene8718-1103_t
MDCQILSHSEIVVAFAGSLLLEHWCRYELQLRFLSNTHNAAQSSSQFCQNHDGGYFSRIYIEYLSSLITLSPTQLMAIKIDPASLLESYGLSQRKTSQIHCDASNNSLDGSF